MKLQLYVRLHNINVFPLTGVIFLRELILIISSENNKIDYKSEVTKHRGTAAVMCRTSNSYYTAQGLYKKGHAEG